MPLQHHCALLPGSTTRHITQAALANTVSATFLRPPACQAYVSPVQRKTCRTWHTFGVVQGAWRGRQNASAALAVVDSFFTSVISGALAHDVQAKDLDLPLHSARTHDLLADNTSAINLSYTVY